MRIDEDTITIDQSPVFYRRAPSPGTPPLYLHGIPTSSDDWIPFLERTGGVAPDLIGFGRSGKGGHLDYSLEGLTRFVERFLEAVRLQRLALVVHGWGAAPGLMFAQRHPERIHRLVLLNALPLLEGFRWRGLARAWRAAGIGELAMGSTTKRLLGAGLRRGCLRAEAWPSERIASVWEQFDQGTQRAILRLHRDADEKRLAAVGGALEAVQAPVLVMWGERDPWLAPAFADAYASRLPGATVDRVTDAGHWPWLDQPKVVSRVAEFLEGDDERKAGAGAASSPPAGGR